MAAVPAAKGPPGAWRPEAWLADYQLPSCTEAPIDKFKVRNRFYLNKGHALKGKKEPPGVRGYSLKVTALVRSEEPLSHIARLFPLPPKPAGAPPSIVIAFHVNTPGEQKQNVIFLFDKEPALDAQADARDLGAYMRLEREVFRPGSQLGAERLKVIPYLSDGASWALGSVVNNQCGQLAAAIGVTQHHGDGAPARPPPPPPPPRRRPAARAPSAVLRAQGTWRSTATCSPSRARRCSPRSPSR